MALEATGRKGKRVGPVDHHALHAKVRQNIRERYPCSVFRHARDLVCHHDPNRSTEHRDIASAHAIDSLAHVGSVQTIAGQWLVHEGA